MKYKCYYLRSTNVTGFVFFLFFLQIAFISAAQDEFSKGLALNLCFQRSDIIDLNRQRDSDDYYADMEPVHGYQVGITKTFIENKKLSFFGGLRSSLKGFKAQNVFDFDVIEEIQVSPEFYYLKSNEDKNYLLYGTLIFGARKEFSNFSLSLNTGVSLLLDEWLDREIWRYNSVVFENKKLESLRIKETSIDNSILGHIELQLTKQLYENWYLSFSMEFNINNYLLKNNGKIQALRGYNNSIGIYYLLNKN